MKHGRNDSYLKELGMNFRVERTRQRLTMQQLADRSGINKETVLRIENGQDAPSILTVKRLAQGLGKPLSEFV